MARIVLKDPNRPSLKKQQKSRADIYKRYLRISIILNILLASAFIYKENKHSIDVLFLKLSNIAKKHNIL